MLDLNQTPIVASALRVTVEVFRVVSGDQNKLNIISLLEYMNKTEHLSLTVGQMLELFQITSRFNLEHPVMQKMKKKQKLQQKSEVDTQYKALRTYDLL